jgi:sulfur carrier protein ThiS
MPSCELPAMRMTASGIFETLGVPPAEVAVAVESLMPKFD